MSGDKKPEKDNETPTTIITGDTVILNSTGAVHVGSGTQINIQSSGTANQGKRTRS